MTAIEEAFAKEGYANLPFSVNGVGHPMIKATLANNVEANFLLDTGAAINLLDHEFAKGFDLKLTPTGEKGGGAGGATSIRNLHRGRQAGDFYRHQTYL